MNLHLPDQLRERLTGPLPGYAAQRMFAPDHSYGRQAPPAPDSARPAAVIALIYPHEGQWHIPLTVRPDHMAAHAGQISLPGGMVEYGESSRTAALRELEEELGVAGGVDVVGRLTDFYVYVSDFRVTTWVGFLTERPQWRPSPDEVAAIVETPLAHLVDPANAGELIIDRAGGRFRAPCFAWRDYRIWGATSMMLNELVEILREFQL